MLRIWYLLLCMALTLAVSAQRTRVLEQVAYAMAGSYSSAEQAKADSSYLELELEIIRIWHKRKDGAWLYGEQAHADNKDLPTAQWMYHLSQVNDSTFTWDMLSIRNAPEFRGAYAETGRLLNLSIDSLERQVGCTITLHKRGQLYVGSTKERECSGTMGNAAYTSTEVVLTNERLVIWDRGWNAGGKQVWGAEVGGYVFLKR